MCKIQRADQDYGEDFQEVQAYVTIQNPGTFEWQRDKKIFPAKSLKSE